MIMESLHGVGQQVDAGCSGEGGGGGLQEGAPSMAQGAH